jgi:hypothetical protein
MFGRPVSEAGIVDASGVAEAQLLRLEEQGILRKVDLETEDRFRALESRVEELERLLVEHIGRAST